MTGSADPNARARQATLLLERIAQGEEGLASELLDLLYGELHDLASRLMRGERRDHTLQPTALVNEAWMRIDPGRSGSFKCRAQFFQLASRAMRSVLVDYARRKKSLKRGGGAPIELLDEAEIGGTDNDSQRVLDVEAALQELATKDEELAQIVEMRFFGGLGAAEIGEALGKTRRQIEGSWAFARGWLQRELDRYGDEGRSAERNDG